MEHAALNTQATPFTDADDPSKRRMTLDDFTECGSGEPASPNDEFVLLADLKPSHILRFRSDFLTFCSEFEFYIASLPDLNRRAAQIHAAPRVDRAPGSRCQPIATVVLHPRHRSVIFFTNCCTLCQSRI